MGVGAVQQVWSVGCVEQQPWSAANGKCSHSKYCTASLSRREPSLHLPLTPPTYYGYTHLVEQARAPALPLPLTPAPLPLTPAATSLSRREPSRWRRGAWKAALHGSTSTHLLGGGARVRGRGRARVGPAGGAMLTMATLTMHRSTRPGSWRSIGVITR